MDDPLKLVDQLQHAVIAAVAQIWPKLLVAAVILVVGVYAGRWLAGALEPTLRRYHLEPPVRQLLLQSVRLLVLLLFAIMAMQNLGIELLPLVAGLGVASAGIALAMQGVLGNVVAGLTIIFTRPFSVEDYISIVGEEGRVEQISLFTTVLSHADRSRIVIPNRKIVGEILHNYGKIRQLDLSVGVAYDSDLDQALAVVHRVLADHPRVLRDPAPVVGVAQLTASWISIAIKPWVNVPDYVAAAGELNQQVVTAFRKDGIVIPAGQSTVQVVMPAHE